MKTGRENPVPTGTVYRLNRLWTFCQEKQETGKKPGKPMGTGAKSVDVFS
jgi:hypothetical protein